MSNRACAINGCAADSVSGVCKAPFDPLCVRAPAATEAVNHPAHYGGDTTYETVKVLAAWGLGFLLGNTVKYISRAGKKGDPSKLLEDLKKARWYLDKAIERIEAKEPLF